MNEINDPFDVILFLLFIIGIIGVIGILILLPSSFSSLNESLFEERNINAKCRFEIGLKDIQINQLKDDIEEYKYNLTQIEVNYWKEKYYEERGFNE